jgi:hypothetical protein
MFTRTKEKLLVMWAELTIYWDPLPYPPDDVKFTDWKDVGRAFIKDIKEILNMD